MACFDRQLEWYSNKLINRVDVVLISHLISKEQLGSANDTYFGDIASELEKNGIKTSVIYIDHAKLASKESAKKYDPSVLVILLTNSLPILKEINIHLKLLKCYFTLKKLRPNSDLMTKILRQGAAEIFTGNSIAALKIENKVSSLIEKMKPKMVIFTYEGHAWERLVNKATKSHNNIISVGYQHSSISKLQHGIFRSLGVNYDPDLILTAGNYGVVRMQQSNINPIRGIHLLGTCKIPKYDRCLNSSKNNQKAYGKPCILVLPEGLDSEVEILFKFTQECAEIDKNIKYIFRLHPSVDLKQFNNKFQNQSAFKTNIVISTNSLIDDINCSTHTIYRGSTAAIIAMNSGLIPIYLKLSDELEIDIIPKGCDIKFEVDTPQDFMKVLKNSREISKANFIEMIEFSKQLMQPFNCNKLIKIIKGQNRDE
jgi:hypothetical protein